MTIDEFLEKLEECREGYTWTTAGRIRASNPYGFYCPVTLIAGQFHGEYVHPLEYKKVADMLGLSDEDVEAIVSSSDGVKDELRERIIEAVAP